MGMPVAGGIAEGMEEFKDEAHHRPIYGAPRKHEQAAPLRLRW